MPSVYAGLLTNKADLTPSDSNGRAIPNATYQLYLPGTKTPPTYYTDRIKTSTVAGDPRTNANGNPEGWCEPGEYEYWFNGQFVGLVQIQEDNSEDDVALAAAVAAIGANLSTNYYDKDQVDSAIESGGGPDVGSELLANKNVNNGYAGLDESGVVADAQLPDGLERTSGKNVNNGYAGLDGSGRVPLARLPIGPLTGTHVTVQTEDYVANYGDVVVIGSHTVTLPAPGADKAPITIISAAGDEESPITQIALNDEDTISIGSGSDSPIAAVTYVASADGWQQLNALMDPNKFIQVSSFGLGGLPAVSQIIVDAAPGIAFGDADSFTELFCTNESGTEIVLSANATYAVISITQAQGAGQVHITVEDGGSWFEPDGHEYTAKEGATVVAKVLGGTGQWYGGGYSGDAA